MELVPIFRRMVEEDASDLFLKVGLAPAMRVSGKVKMIGGPPVTLEDIQAAFDEIADERIKEKFYARGETDSSYEVYGIGRFRVNIFRQRGYIGMVFRLIKSIIPSMEELSLPADTLRKIAAEPRGLILVTGTAGSGKSTTMATMIEYINANYEKHIVTVEDPIEFMFEDKRSVIDQREVGQDTESFANALKGAVRQSPDVIMIGEMRDLETMEAAFNAAETGHLVFSTLHTVNAMQTVERILNYIPTHQHLFYQKQMALLLEAVVSIRLLPTKDGGGRVPAIEIMINTPTVRELLEEGKVRELYKAIKEGAYFGNMTFNQSLKDLLMKDLITLEDAMLAADSPDELKLEIRGIQKGSKTGDFNFNA